MTYDEALAEYRNLEPSKWSDSAAMAAYCDMVLQHVVGAVSPELVWKGAQKQGMTHSELATLAVESPMQVSDLMWI